MNHDRHGHSFVVSAAKGHMGSWKLEYPTPTKTPHRNVTFRIPPVLWQKNNEKEARGVVLERRAGGRGFGLWSPTPRGGGEFEGDNWEHRGLRGGGQCLFQTSAFALGGHPGPGLKAAGCREGGLGAFFKLIGQRRI